MDNVKQTIANPFTWNLSGRFRGKKLNHNNIKTILCYSTINAYMLLSFSLQEKVFG